MTYKTFAAINVGSGEVSMKIYEISPKTGIREIDYVRYYIELGSDTYTKVILNTILSGNCVMSWRAFPPKWKSTGLTVIWPSAAVH